jgi:hypothetical protein
MPLVDKPFNASDRLKDYTDVKQRIALFYAKHPDGRLVTDSAWVSVDDDVPRIWVRALAYRTADDPHPGVGNAWMVLPGTTSFTRGSELMNTETSAWGRAIGSLGIGIGDGIASVDEIASAEGQTDRVAAKKQWDDSHAGDMASNLGRPELERRADGLIGTVVKGATPADLELRYDPDGVAFWGFKLKAGKTAYQAFATGPLAEQLRDAAILTDEAFEGQRVAVWGKVEMVPWFKGDKAMPPYARIVVERLATSEWTMPPAQDTLTVPMFDEAAS